MADLSIFKPKKELDARAQVEHFIRFYRDEATVWPEEIKWDSLIWDITQVISRTGRKCKKTIRWTKIPETYRGRKSEPMAQPFGDFARAFITYRATEIRSLSDTFMALRIIEKALLDRSTDGETCIERLDSDVLNRCKEIIVERYAPSSHFDLANFLIYILRFLVDNSMLNNPCDWANPFPFFNKFSIDTDQEILVNRDKKLPTEAAYYALMEINAKHERGDLPPRDQVVTSLCMICCAAPERSAEIAHIRWDPMRDGHAIGNATKLFLAWYPVKGGDPQLKPVPDAWEEVTRKAIIRLQKLSAPAREIVTWYENNPDKIYLPAEYEYLRGREWLTIREVGILLGIKKSGVCNKFRPRLKDNNRLVVRRKPDPNWTNLGATPYLYNFVDLERYVLSKLPKHFPFVDPDRGLRYSEMLNIYPFGLLNTQHKGSNCSLVMFDWFDATAFESTINDSRGENMFARHGFFEDEARTKPLRINTHSFRHMMVTMGQEAGMSDLEMTEFRGSKVVEQTGVYTHLTSKERMLALGMDPEKGTVSRDDGGLQIRPVTEVDIQRLMKRGFQLHSNEYGLCAHPIEQEPCPRFLDCLGCTEQLCMVGDKGKRQNIEREVQRARDCLTNAENIKQEDEEDGYETSDAAPWIKSQKGTIEDGEALLEILRDPAIPEGTWVRRTGPNRYDPYIEMVTARVELTGAEEDIRLLGRMTLSSLPEKATDA